MPSSSSTHAESPLDRPDASAVRAAQNVSPGPAQATEAVRHPREHGARPPARPRAGGAGAARRAPPRGEVGAGRYIVASASQKNGNTNAAKPAATNDTLPRSKPMAASANSTTAAAK